jgi:hypothetical protein
MSVEMSVEMSVAQCERVSTMVELIVATRPRFSYVAEQDCKGTEVA